jgi:hypothetical protein
MLLKNNYMRPFRNMLSMLVVTINIVFANHCTAQSIEQHGDTSVLIIGKNRFIMDSVGIDTVYVTDPVYNKTAKVFSPIHEAISVNGEKIYRSAEVSSLPVVSSDPNMPLDEYLVNKIIKTLHCESFPNRKMRVYMDRLMIDKAGYLDLYHLERISSVGPDNIERRSVPFYDDTLYTALTATPQFKPATLNGNNVNALLDLSLAVFDIKIQDHVASVTRRQD